MRYNCIALIGPTASGKTNLACKLAYYLNGEIISADSRQVYKHLTIGTGKDLESYTVNNKKINYYLIDIIEPQQQFYLHDFIRELKTAFTKITDHKKLPIICGGSGLYIDALKKDFSLTQIKENENLRLELVKLSKVELQQKLISYTNINLSHTDVNSTKRLIRAIEIAEAMKSSETNFTKTELPYKPYYIGISVNNEERKNLINKRLHFRLENGLIEETEWLLNNGINHERLQFLGLEYKFLSYYLQHKISKEELHTKLSTAIYQFSKRQMTWFRKMEKEGVKINWIDKSESIEKLSEELKLMFNS
jgi:tRNA dimethylallyltransferase